MGSSLGLKDLCDQTPVLQTSPKDMNDIPIDQNIVSCQICKNRLKSSEMKEHIDLAHYAFIKQEKDGKAVVQCLLCGQFTFGLMQHNSHVVEKHPYAEMKAELKSNTQGTPQKQKKKIEEIQLNKDKKNKVLKLKSYQDFQILEQNQINHYEALVFGSKHDVIKYAKQYSKADYNQQLVEAELVWYKIFKQKRNFKCYYLDLDPGQRHILCKSYIFMANNL